MSKPYVHAVSSAKKFGGIWEDYIDIHEFLDSSKAVMSDLRHRALDVGPSRFNNGKGTSGA